MLLQHVLLAIVWTVYCVLHSVLADLRVKNWVQQKAGKSFRYYRLFYTLFAAIALAALVLYQFSMTSLDVYRPTIFTNIVGGLVAVSGLAVMVICIQKYFLSLSGLRSLYQETPAAELMIAGIHRYMRHPLYTGTFLAIWGFWIIFPTLSLLITDAIITVYTLLAIQLEEEKLVAAFGDQYRRYQRTVPKLIPRFVGRKLLAERT